MTEEQIERRVEAKMDALDRTYLADNLTEIEYDAAVKDLDEWAENQYRIIIRSPNQGNGI